MLDTILAAIFPIAALIVFVLLLRNSRSTPPGDAVIDPTDPSQIGALIGLMGGTIQDAAIAQFALKRFEEEHGRKATVSDMGTVAGIMRTLR